MPADIATGGRQAFILGFVRDGAPQSDRGADGL